MKFNFKPHLNKKDKDKCLKFPKEMSSELAEIIGIHFGDGSMTIDSKRTHRIRYSFNLRDREYGAYVQNLFYKNFNMTLKTREIKNKRELELYFYSKNLCLFFNNYLKIPFSPKNNLTIPHYLKTNNEYLISFIRGLFDTDGCITTQRQGKYNYTLIKICTGISSFAEEIKETLDYLHINCYISTKATGYDVVIRRKESLNRFLSLITPKNNKGRNGDAGI